MIEGAKYFAVETTPSRFQGELELLALQRRSQRTRQNLPRTSRRTAARARAAPAPMSMTTKRGGGLWRAARHIQPRARVRVVGPSVLRGLARLRCDRHRQWGAARRPKDGRRAGDQSRVDPEDPSRQGNPRLLAGSRDGYHHPAHARLCALHHAAVLAHPDQLPARPRRRHLQPVHCALDPDA